MNSIFEIIIYFIAILGIFFTYISLKDYDELYVDNKYSICDLNVKKVEIIIKTVNYNEEEINNVLEIIKNGKFDNLSNIVDNIKIEKYNSFRD